MYRPERVMVGRPRRSAAGLANHEAYRVILRFDPGTALVWCSSDCSFVAETLFVVFDLCQ